MENVSQKKAKITIHDIPCKQHKMILSTMEDQVCPQFCGALLILGCWYPRNVVVEDPREYKRDEAKKLKVQSN